MNQKDKSKNNTIDKLRMTLDNPVITISKEQYQKNLESLRQRLLGTTRISSNISNNIKEKEFLQPQVSIHRLKIPEISKKIEKKSDEEDIKELEEFKEVIYEEEELFEVEKIDQNLTEFTEIKQKEHESDLGNTKEDDLKVSFEEVKDDTTTPEFFIEEVPEWEPIESETDDTMSQNEEKPSTKTEILNKNRIDLDKKNLDETEGKIKSDNLEGKTTIMTTTYKNDIFNGIESIDDTVADILVNNNLDSVDKLQKCSIKDLVKIKGINRKTAKKIKNELEQDGNWEYLEFEEDEKENKITSNDLSSGWEPAKDLSNKKDVINNLDDITCLDKKTRDLLIVNGITSVDKLRVTPIKNIIKIKGVRRGIAKRIKKELSENYELLNDKDWDADIESNNEQKFETKKLKNNNKNEPQDESGYKYKSYILYKKTIDIGKGNKRTIHFFSKTIPDESEPIKLPEGYEVKENSKTGVPYLRKKR